MPDYTPTEVAARQLIAAARHMGCTLTDGALASETIADLRTLFPSSSPSLKALHEIADLGSCAGGGLSRAVEIATTAIAIEARSYATGTGAAEGESAAIAPTGDA